MLDNELSSISLFETEYAPDTAVNPDKSNEAIVLTVTFPTTDLINFVTADTSAGAKPSLTTEIVTFPLIIATLPPNSFAKVNSAAFLMFKSPVYTLLDAKIAEISSCAAVKAACNNATSAAVEALSNAVSNSSNLATTASRSDSRPGSDPLVLN